MPTSYPPLTARAAGSMTSSFPSARHTSYATMRISWPTKSTRDECIGRTYELGVSVLGWGMRDGAEDGQSDEESRERMARVEKQIERCRGRETVMREQGTKRTDRACSRPSSRSASQHGSDTACDRTPSSVREKARHQAHFHGGAVAVFCDDLVF